jgi:DNA-binding transcriptional MocR family regulator
LLCDKHDDDNTTATNATATSMTAILSALEERMDQPTARGLAHAVSRAIRDGILPAGTKLPPIREVATQLALSPTTVSAGWALLARSGTLRSDGRRGTTVADPLGPSNTRYRRALEGQAGFALDLSTGVPDAALLPSLGRALRRLTTAGTPGSYLDEAVLPELREVLLDEWPYVASDISIVDGAMDALDLIVRTAIRFGDRVIVEHPCFPPLLDLLDSIGADVVGVPLDAEGMRPDLLAAALASPAAAVVLQPTAQNPSGVSTTADRARALAALIDRAGTIVIEDDSAGAIASTAAISLGRWTPERTVHIRSFSKSHGPDLRLAAVSGPAQLIHNVLARRQLGQGWSSRLLQRILLSLLTDEGSRAEVKQAQHEYARRRAALVDALAERGVDVGGTDGINIWVPVHDEAAALIRLASQGIGVTPGSPFAVLPGMPGHIRVTCGLVGAAHVGLADQIAAAANTTGWAGRGR